MKTLLGIALAVAASLSAMGQGRVAVTNNTRYGTNRIFAPFFDAGGVALAGDAYLVQFYVGRHQEDMVPVGPTGSFANGLIPGLFPGYVVDIPFVSFFEYAWMQIRVWKAADGATFEEAALNHGWTGVSNLLYVQARGFPGGVPDAPAALVGLKYPGVPWIVEQPRDAGVRAGYPVTLAVTASTTIQPTYQWFDADTQQPVPGATNAVFTTPGLNQTHRYQVRVGNSAGITDSRVATVAVTDPASGALGIVWHSNQPTLSVDAVPGLAYRVEYSADPVNGTWSPLTDFTAYTRPFVFTDIGAAGTGARFYRVVAP